MVEKGTVLKGVSGNYTVLPDKSDKEISVRGRGSFRHDKMVLLAGDRVEITEVAKDEYFCKAILTRKNELIRPPLANLDVMFIVVSCADPAPVLLTVDKLVSICEYKKITPVIVISKTDIEQKTAEKIAEIYKKSGFDVFLTSSENNDGIDDFLCYLKDFTRKNTNPVCAFSGASGAGKSTLMNSVFPSLNLETGELSRKISRGKNTTRKTELFPLRKLLGDGYSGFFADTPGFSLLDFERFDFFSLNDLFDTFREFAQSAGKCRYTKCSHTKEEGCDIIKRVKNGDIAVSRYESYLALYEILKQKPAWKSSKK